MKNKLSDYVVSCDDNSEQYAEYLKEQSVVEWLDFKLNVEKQMISKDFQMVEICEIFDKATEMEKEQRKVTENTSDGYHTFKELYEFRKAYNVALFNEWGQQTTSSRKFVTTSTGYKEIAQEVNYKFDVHKSWKHHDGELCFGGGWFIVVAILPEGQISNHYKEEDWDLFKIPALEKAKYPFDGHTGSDVISRLINI